MALLVVLAGCGRPPSVARFAGTTPAFDPLAFWTGHVRSWGVVEDRSGAPTETVATDCVGTRDASGALTMRQVITEGDGTITHRDWVMRAAGPGRYDATAGDMVGVAHGEAAGRAFHWVWRWRRTGGFTVTMSQWMYLYPDGTLLNRTTIGKFGVTLAEVSETFKKEHLDLHVGGYGVH